MSVPYSVSLRKNLLRPDEPGSYFANAQSRSEATFKTLCEQIGDRCTVTRSDVKAVLDALMIVTIEKLKEGQIVRFDDFGSFQISLSSKGAATEEEFNSTMIKSSKIIFRPADELKSMTKILKYEKVSPLPKKVKKTPSEPATGE